MCFMKGDLDGDDVCVCGQSELTAFVHFTQPFVDAVDWKDQCTACCDVPVTGDQDCGAKGLGACGNLVGVWSRAQRLGGAIGVFSFDRVLALARGRNSKSLVASGLTFQRMSPCVLFPGIGFSSWGPYNQDYCA